MSTAPTRTGRLARAGAAWRAGCALLVTAAVALSVAPGVAGAQTTGPKWLPVVAGPNRTEPGSTFTYRVIARNLGDTATDGTGALDVSLPAGASIVSVTSGVFGSIPPFYWDCGDPAGQASMHCDATFPLPIGPSEAHLEPLLVTVAVTGDAFGTSRFELSGGGAASPTRVEHPLSVSSTPAFGITAVDGGAFDDTGDAYTQASGHPTSAAVAFEFSKVFDAGQLVTDGGNLRNVEVDLPAGFVGNPTTMPRCPKSSKIPSESDTGSTFDPNLFCSTETVVGIAEITLIGFEGPIRMSGPVFNLEPPPGVAAQFAFSFGKQKAILDARVRTDGDYGVTVSTRDASEIKTVIGSEVTLWGVPADHSHDDQRCVAFIGGVPVGSPPRKCDPFSFGQPWLSPSSANVKPRAFLTNPAACTPPDVGLKTVLRAESWDPTSAPDAASFVSHLTPGLPLPRSQWGAPAGPDGCENVPFDPSLELEADSAKADAPSGLSVGLSFPQDGLVNPTGLATGQLKRATVTLPEGWSVSPSAADGLAGCSDAQSRVGTLLGAECPAASKIGTVEATTPLLEEKLSGGVYVGTQESDDPLSGQMFRMFIALNSEERGIRVKLPGQIRIDPDSGRIETTFDNNPQVPVSSIELRLDSGPRAPLATPFGCGTKTATAQLESWSGQVVTRTSDLTIDCPGAGPLAPSFRAGVTSNFAGRHTSFGLRAERPEATQVVDGLSLRMPPGLLAKLKGVPRCADGAATAGTCPESSRVGTATTGSGPGTNPFFLQGGVYLTGPYKKGPFGLVVAVRAKAGPFDLGTVVVRQQLIVDPVDAHVDVVSDPLPTILKGVPVRLRSLNVDVDRKDFVLNPTSCRAKTIVGAFSSPEGTTFDATSPFGVGDCAALPFKPKLALRLTGKKQATTGKHPGIRAQVTQAGVGEAAIGRAKVTLPKSLALDPDNAQALCEFADGTKPDLENHCPKGSIVGRVRAVTPLLDEPLTGNVYFVKNVRRSSTGNLIRTLPMIVVALRGEIAINLKGESSTTRDGKLVNTFANVPDAPVSRFNLNINGGSNGILAVTRTRQSRINLCTNPRDHLANVEMDGQNQKRADYRTRVKTPCAAKASKKAKARKGR